MLLDAIMRWSYKTVHYELKKEGLLGNAFLDESEVEISLNEYGKAGWELVSILETREGLIAVLKQPISGGGMRETSIEEDETQYIPLRPRKDDFEPETEVAGENIPAQRSARQAPSIDEYEIVVEDQQTEDKEPRKKKNDIGSIRIE
jgi:hypothetical protein